MLAGKHLEISPGNPKWAYVKAAMDATSAQFHDRHEDYSKQVQSYLSKLAASYDQKYETSQKSCKDCEKASRPEGTSSSEVGPPFGIVARLATASSFFRGYLVAMKGVLGAQSADGITTTAENIYTSGWVSAWYKYVKSKRPALASGGSGR